MAAVLAGVSGGVAGSEAVQAGLGVSVQPYRFNGKESQEFAGFLFPKVAFLYLTSGSYKLNCPHKQELRIFFNLL